MKHANRTEWKSLFILIVLRGTSHIPQQRVVQQGEEHSRRRSCRVRPIPRSRDHGVLRHETRTWAEGGRGSPPRVVPATLHGCSGASEKRIEGEAK